MKLIFSLVNNALYKSIYGKQSSLIVQLPFVDWLGILHVVPTLTGKREKLLQKIDIT